MSMSLKARVDTAERSSAEAIGAHEIGLEAKRYKAIFGRPMRDDPRPWKRGLLEVTVEKRTVVRIFRGASGLGVTKEEALLERSSARELGIEKGGVIKVRAARPLSGRVKYHWNHPDDQHRVAFKLGLVGVVLGFLSLLLTVM